MTEAIDRLANDIKAVLGETQDMSAIVSRVAALAKPLADDQSWVGAACYETDESQGIGVHILHEEPDHNLLIETVCWQPGRGVKPHDHQTWGVVVGLDGDERNVSWRRLDDGTKPGFADLVEDKVTIAQRGDVICLQPDDIHSVTNEGEKPSLSLHIYGRSLAHVNRSEFEPAEKLQRPCPQRIRRR